VTALTALVNSECGPDGLVLHIKKETEVRKYYPACNAVAEMKEFFKVLDLWIQKNEKID
jgi:hypothetical protein